MAKPSTEREQQEALVWFALRSGKRGFRYFYRLADGRTFQAVAMTESGAFRVLNAEHPGTTATALSREVA